MTACRLQAAHHVIGPFEGLTHKAAALPGGGYLPTRHLIGQSRRAERVSVVVELPSK